MKPSNGDYSNENWAIEFGKNRPDPAKRTADQMVGQKARPQMDEGVNRQALPEKKGKSREDDRFRGVIRRMHARDSDPQRNFNANHDRTIAEGKEKPIV